MRALRNDEGSREKNIEAIEPEELSEVFARSKYDPVGEPAFFTCNGARRLRRYDGGGQVKD
jgi:hypothetical protein